MAAIWTSKGFLPEDELTMTNGGHDNENETTTWQEWRDETGEVVKRDVQIRLKRMPAVFGEIGAIG